MVSLAPGYPGALGILFIAEMKVSGGCASESLPFKGVWGGSFCGFGMQGRWLPAAALLVLQMKL